MKILATVLTGLIAVSLVSYGTSVGKSSMTFMPDTANSVDGRAVSSSFAMVQSIETLGLQRANAGDDNAITPDIVARRRSQRNGQQCSATFDAAVTDSRIEKTVQCGLLYRVTLQTDEGSLQSYVQRAPLSSQVGDRVLIATDLVE